MLKKRKNQKHQTNNACSECGHNPPTYVQREDRFDKICPINGLVCPRWLDQHKSSKEV